MAEKIKLVIFDMDGLMFDTERLHLEGWLQAAKTMGVRVNREIFIRTLGSPIAKVERVFKDEFGEDFDFFALRALRVKIVEDYLSKNPMPKKKGLCELLDFLEKNNIKRALATSTIEKEAVKCLKWGKVEKSFEVFVFGDMVKRGKPDPEIFLKAASLAQVSPENALVLEDSPAGIGACGAAQMRGVMVPDMTEPTEKERNIALCVKKDLLEVIDLIREINQIGK